VQDFRNLKVWQKAHEYVLAVYRATANFPSHETFGLRSQIRRASYSIPSNVAEGCGRGSDQDFARFLQIAMGSACEAEYQLLLAGDLGYLTPEDGGRLNAILVEVKRMLSALLTTVKPV
jgi:four helix bundle protein